MKDVQSVVPVVGGTGVRVLSWIFFGKFLSFSPFQSYLNARGKAVVIARQVNLFCETAVESRIGSSNLTKWTLKDNLISFFLSSLPLLLRTFGKFSPPSPTGVSFSQITFICNFNKMWVSAQVADSHIHPKCHLNSNLTLFMSVARSKIGGGVTPYPGDMRVFIDDVYSNSVRRNIDSFFRIVSKYSLFRSETFERTAKRQVAAPCWMKTTVTTVSGSSRYSLHLSSRELSRRKQ